MASVYKRKQDKSNRRSCWYIGYKDYTGKRRTVRGFTDKSSTERLAADLEEEARLIRAGLKPKPVEIKDGKLAANLNDFRRHLKNRDVSAKQVKQVSRRVERTIEAAAFEVLSDINATDVENVFGDWREKGMSKQTSNHYTKAFQQFCRWLVTTKRLSENPLLELPILNAETDRRHDRRPLTQEELVLVVETAGSSERVVESINGPHRAMMYVLAAWTGYRKGEIGSLTLRSFDLEHDPPTVTVTANYSKRGRRDTQVLHPTVVERFREWLATREPGPDELLFPVSAESGAPERKTAKMMRLDLEAAREKWLRDTEPEAERNFREQTDFLCYCDHQGRYADFHANRHTFITNLARAGVTPKTAQTLARHSDIRLTMGVYTHTNLDEQIEAVNQLPGLTESAQDDGESEESDEASEGWEHSGSAPVSQSGILRQPVTTKEPDSLPNKDRESSPQVAELSAVGDYSRQQSVHDGSTPGRIRTYDLRFRRPLLYPTELRARENGFQVGRRLPGR